MHFFVCSIDSTVVHGNGLGRYVNDGAGTEANCRMRLIEINKEPHLALFASKNIQMGEELRYDYGVPDLAWRKAKVV